MKPTRRTRACPSSPATGETGSPESLDLEQFLPYRISVLSNRVSGNIARLYGDRYGLAITEWRVMAILPVPGPVGQRGVRTHGDGQGGGQPRGGAPARTRLHPARNPRRRPPPLGAALLPAGFEVYETMAPMVIESERRLLGALTEEERSALDRLITRLETAGLQAQAELR
jgi:hypothetical protein